MISSFLGALATVGLGAEVLSRVAHLHKYGIPYRPRIYGDYRYREFIATDNSGLGNRLVRSYRSNCVNINRYGLRGSEPDEIGARKRVLLLGESDFFGVKLSDERKLWSEILNVELDRDIKGSWEILNGGHPGYNSTQHLKLMSDELLGDVSPDILLLRIGGNDISQAYTMEEKWTPSFVWPVKFLWAMNSVQSRRDRALLQSCLFYMYRGKDLYRRNFGSVVKTFLPGNKDKVLPIVVENYRKLIALSRARGSNVAVIGPWNLENCQLNDEVQKALDCLNEGWRAFSEGYGAFYREVQSRIGELCSELEVPYLDMASYMEGRHKVGTLFYDGVHWNERGHRATSDFIRYSLEKLRWI